MINWKKKKKKNYNQIISIRKPFHILLVYSTTTNNFFDYLNIENLIWEKERL